jgi:hypothetical protein
MTMGKSKIDNRKHHRLPIVSTTFVELESPELGEADSGKLATCKSLDISRDGLQVLLEEEITVGALLQLGVELPNVSDPLYLVGEVRWCRTNLEMDGTWLAGFQLMNANDSDINHWVDLVVQLDR